ncbi:MAG TPA: ribosome silencing factor [Caldimonas sp.]|nr:ribosome silencing factor [Caldimonas sp.]
MDIRKLQRAIVDGLEDVKGQNIVIFNTEHLSPLFERVIIASGTSNRQTKALAASVRDAVKAAGGPSPRVEGEANGEWIIVDCGPAVVHVMQPTFREYYHLEELWGDKPVRMRLGAEAPAVRASHASAHDGSAGSAAPAKKKPADTRKRGAAKSPSTATKAPAAKARKTAAKSPAVKKPVRKTTSPRAKGHARGAGVRTSSGVVRSAPAKKTATRKAAPRTGRSRA